MTAKSLAALSPRIDALAENPTSKSLIWLLSSFELTKVGLGEPRSADEPQEGQSESLASSVLSWGDSSDPKLDGSVDPWMQLAQMLLPAVSSHLLTSQVRPLRLGCIYLPIAMDG